MDTNHMPLRSQRLEYTFGDFLSTSNTLLRHLFICPDRMIQIASTSPTALLPYGSNTAPIRASPSPDPRPNPLALLAISFAPPPDHLRSSSPTSSVSSSPASALSTPAQPPRLSPATVLTPMPGSATQIPRPPHPLSNGTNSSSVLSRLPRLPRPMVLRRPRSPATNRPYLRLDSNISCRCNPCSHSRPPTACRRKRTVHSSGDS